jgi:hypothetical protein
MNLQDLIDQRLFLTYLQQGSLIRILTSHCNSEIKRKVAQNITYNFYSIFDGEIFAKDFEVRDNYIVCVNNMKLSVPNIRKAVLNYTGTR